MSGSVAVLPRAWIWCFFAFLRRALAKLTWRGVLIAHAVGVLWFSMPLIWSMRASWPPTFPWSVAVISELTVVFILLAILLAQEAVESGARRIVAFPFALIVAAACTAISQWYVRGWLGLFTLVNRPGIDPALQRTQMLFLALDVIIHGGLVMLIYVNHRQRVDFARATGEAELARAHAEQALMDTRLATSIAAVDPQVLFADLERIEVLLGTAPREAVRVLDASIHRLRLLARYSADGSSVGPTT